MKYPALLLPTATQKIELASGRVVEIPKANPQFKKWTGASVSDTFGGKGILELDGKPGFAELIILRIFQNAGWSGVWVDTFGKYKYRTEYWPKNEIELPGEQLSLLNGIYRKAGSKGGCFDVFCWKENTRIFAESKWNDNDRIQDSQRRWLEAAINCRLPIESFLIVEWSIANE